MSAPREADIGVDSDQLGELAIYLAEYPKGSLFPAALRSCRSPPSTKIPLYTNSNHLHKRPILA